MMSEACFELLNSDASHDLWKPEVGQAFEISEMVIARYDITTDVCFDVLRKCHEFIQLR